MPGYQRPPFWRVPHQRRDPEDERQIIFGNRNKNKHSHCAGALRCSGVAAAPGAAPRTRYREAAAAALSARSRPLTLAMGRLHTFVVTLRRESRDTNWGLRLVGGADLATPLIVTRVTPGSPAGRDLVRGDIIAKIDDYDARDLRHEDAQNLFKNAQNQIRIVVQRDVDRQMPSGTPSAPRSPLPASAVSPSYRTPSPMAAPPYRGGAGPESLPRTPIPPYPVQSEGEYRAMMLSPSSNRTDDTCDESLQSQVSFVF
ncbi:unnamed protein product [Plutella xylostella]|uniref:(diamondback moth) hypothetical protein n=1 Tax=Plutella xylostella TaxID=51655 RepID=A0A8S4EIQ3_PLUXY|nr:unnamed protein product [Plutella xylostella]